MHGDITGKVGFGDGGFSSKILMRLVCEQNIRYRNNFENLGSLPQIKVLPWTFVNYYIMKLWPILSNHLQADNNFLF